MNRPDLRQRFFCDLSEMLAFFALTAIVSVILHLFDDMILAVGRMMLGVLMLNCIVGSIIIYQKSIKVPLTPAVERGAIDLRWGLRKLWWSSWWWRLQ